MDCLCPQCGHQFSAKTAHYNRAENIGAPLYCGRICAGLARRLKNPPTDDERKWAKRQYDKARRESKRNELCAKKREHYYANRERILAEQKVYRAKHMARHVAYCQQPEYKAYKSDYDRKYRAVKTYGEFAEAFLMLIGIDSAVAERATRHEIYSQNETLNKAQKRRRSL